MLIFPVSHMTPDFLQAMGIDSIPTNIGPVLFLAIDVKNGKTPRFMGFEEYRDLQTERKLKSQVRKFHFLM